MNLRKQWRSGLSLGVLVSEAEHFLFLPAVSKLRAFTLRAAKWGRVLLGQPVDVDPE